VRVNVQGLSELADGGGPRASGRLFPLQPADMVSMESDSLGQLPDVHEPVEPDEAGKKL